MLVMLLEDLLPTLGYSVAGSAGSVEQALTDLEANEIDLAVVDVNLAGTESFPVADALRERGIPFLFTTGYGQQGMPARFADTPGAGQALSPARHPGRTGAAAGGAMRHARYDDAIVVALPCS